jgi:hypothetical protein
LFLILLGVIGICIALTIDTELPPRSRHLGNRRD